MKTLLTALLLILLLTSARAADTTVQALPNLASPGDSAVFYIEDPDQATQGRSYLFTNLTTVADVSAATNSAYTSAQAFANGLTNTVVLMSTNSAKSYADAAFEPLLPADATGALTNDGAGNLGWFDLSALPSGGSVTFNALTSIDTTNFVIDAGSSAISYPEIVADADVNFVHCTNGPGVASITIYPAGSDRIVSMPTNWFWLSTNEFTLVGSLWSASVPAGHVGYISVKKRSSGSDQTNVVANFLFSP